MRTKEQRKRNAQAYKKRSPQSYRVSVMLTAAKAHAKKIQVPFAITATDLQPYPELCPVLGIPLKYGYGKRSNNSASLDKFIPELGYVPGNVAIISDLANRIKNNATAAEVRAVADWMEKQCQASQASPATPNSTP
jgi:hypothetical protein